MEEKLAAKEKPLNGDRFSETRLGGAIPRRSLKYSVTAAAAAAKCAKKTSFLLVQVGVPACTIYLFYTLQQQSSSYNTPEASSESKILYFKHKNKVSVEGKGREAMAIPKIFQFHSISSFKMRSLPKISPMCYKEDTAFVIFL